MPWYSLGELCVCVHMHMNGTDLVMYVHAHDGADLGMCGCIL